MRWWPFQKAVKTTVALAAGAPAPAPAEAAPAQLAAGAGDQAKTAEKPYLGPAPVIAPFQKTSRRYPVDAISPERLRFFLRDADLGTTEFFAELLDDVAADTQVANLINVMKLAVAGAPICLEPGDASERGAAIAADCQLFLQKIPDFRQLLIDLLEAEYKGFAAVRPEWQADGPRWQVVGWQSFECRHFHFRPDGETPQLMTADNLSGAPLPEGVLFYRVHQRPGPIMRGGIGWSIARPWLYKGYCLVDGMSFLERFGHPHVQVQLPPNAVEGSKELEMAKNAAKSLIVDQVGLVPPGVELKIIDTIQKAATVKDVYLAFIEWCDAALAKAFLGQSSLTDDQKSEGSQAKAKTGLQVNDKLNAQRAKRLCEFIQKNLINPWTAYHYGPSAPAPLFSLDVEPPEDEDAAASVKEKRARTATILARQLGLPLSRRQLYAEHGYSEPENPDDAIGGTVAQAGGAPGDGAAGAHALGLCPGCGQVISLAAAEKKKRMADWVS